MEKGKRKNIAILPVTLAVLAGLVVWVFHGHTQEIVARICALRPRDLLLLLGLGVVYQLFDAAVCFVLLRGQLPAFSFWQALEVTFLGVFGNVATLSAGSIPMQSYYLHRLGLMAGSGVGTMTLEYVLHKATILLYTTALLLAQGRWLQAAGAGLSRYLLAGYVVCALIILALTLCCAWAPVQTLACRLIERLPEAGKGAGRKRRWKENVAALSQASRRLLRDRGRLRKVAALDVGKLFCLYLIPYLALQMLGVTSLSLGRVQLLTGLTHLIANAIPNVAGMGPTEFAFLLIFSPYIGRGQASAALVLYRVATFFFPFLLSVIAFFAAQRRALNGERA